MHLVRRPPPFHTYQTSRDAGGTLETAALDAITQALQAIVAECGAGPRLSQTTHR